MKKSLLNLVFILFLSFVFIIGLTSATIEVKKIDKGSVIISELDNPAVFDFVINNLGAKDTFEIYSFVGVSMTPKGTFDLETGETTISVKAYPSSEIRSRPGLFSFDYQIKGQASGIFSDKLRIEIVELKDTLNIAAENVFPNDEKINVIVRNTKNTNLENLAIHLEAEFFSVDKTISLKPYEEVKVPVKIDSEKLRKLVAGPYVISASLNLEGAKAKIEGIINYAEKEGLTTKQDSKGLFVRKSEIVKTNDGNIPLTARVEVGKNALTRLFTVYSPEPISIDRSGVSVKYVWEQSLDPSDSFAVSVTTNYTFPFLLVILIALIGYLVYRYTSTSVVLNKKVSFVRTKGGQLALRIRVNAKAKKHVDNVEVIDKVPALAKLYDKFGTRPDQIDPATRRLIWKIDRMQPGEERTFTYIVYSTIKIVGRFELPIATAVFEREGKTHEIFSNRAFFLADMVSTNNDN